MKKKLLSLLLASLMLVALVAGCSGGTTNSPAPSPSTGDPTPNTTPSDAPPAEPVTITFGYWGDSGETQAYTKAIENIEANVPGVKVELAHYAGTADFWDSLPGQIAAGTAPDIIAPTNEGHLSYIADGLFLPMDQYGFDLSGFTPNAVDAWSYEGHLYGIPVTAAPGLFVVNKDLWDAAGLGAMPTTWDEVYEAAKVLTKGDVKGLCIDFSQGYHPTQYMNSFGGGWKNGADIDSTANETALDYIFKMYKEGLAVNSKDLGLAWDGEVFAAGKCAMTTAGTWYIGMMKEAAPNTNYEILPMPGGNGNNGCTLHSIAFTVLSNSKNPELAAKVAYYMSREEAQRTTAETVGSMPSLISLRDWYFEQNAKMQNAKVSLDWASSFGYPIRAAEFQTDLVRSFEEVQYAGSNQTSKDILASLAEKYGKN